MSNTIKIARGNLDDKGDLHYGELFLDTATEGGPYVYIGTDIESQKVALNTDSYIESATRTLVLDPVALVGSPSPFYYNTVHIVNDIAESFTISTIEHHSSIRNSKDVKTPTNSIGMIQIKVSNAAPENIEITIPDGTYWAGNALAPSLIPGQTYQITFVYGVFYCSDPIIVP